MVACSWLFFEMEQLEVGESSMVMTDGIWFGEFDNFDMNN